MLLVYDNYYPSFDEGQGQDLSAPQDEIVYGDPIVEYGLPVSEDDYYNDYYDPVEAQVLDEIAYDYFDPPAVVADDYDLQDVYQQQMDFS